MLQHIYYTSGLIPSFKVLLLIIASISHYVGFKSPNPPPSEEQTVYKGQIFERIVRLLAAASQVSTILTLICECIVITSLQYSSHQSHSIFTAICPHPSPSLDTTISSLTPSFLFGIGVMLSAAALRVWCFQTLGKLFTFEVSIKPEHKLITSGPYGFARHPSYTGCVLMLIGAALTCFSSGSFLNECGIMSTPARWPIRIWLSVAVFASISLYRRGSVEDEGLKKVFGVTWDQYSQRVPQRFIPYLL